MSQQQKIIPFSLRETPSLIESVLPVQKLSVDVYKERMAGSGQTLTGLGSYWKGRKPLVLNKACILGCLLPATKNIKRDLEVFELLMGMDEVTLSKRYGLPKPKELLAQLKLPNIWDYFDVSPPELRSQLPHSAPFILDDYKVVSAGGSLAKPIISWRKDLSEDQKHSLACAAMPAKAYRELATTVSRVEEINGFAHSHIWEQVNSHLGTDANSFSELINQLGIMRFGRRPVLADTFSGSGQIPFEAARLGCDVIASDLNPIACMLTWGAFNIVGSNVEQKNKIELEQRALIEGVRSEIDALNIETDGKGWRGKVYLYCLEITCPETGWRVPLLPSLIISQTKKIVCKLVPDELNKRYRIDIVNNASDDEMTAAKKGSYQDQSMVHTVGGIEYRSKIATIRGDFNDNENGKRIIKNKLRQWEKSEVMYRSDDIFSERLYAIQWIKDDGNSRSDVEFRGITADDEDPRR